MGIRALITATVVAGIITPLAAAGLMSGRPEEAGLSAERLVRIRDAVKRSLDGGSPSGAVTLVARRGKIARAPPNSPAAAVVAARPPADGQRGMEGKKIEPPLAAAGSAATGWARGAIEIAASRWPHWPMCWSNAPTAAGCR